MGIYSTKYRLSCEHYPELKDNKTKAQKCLPNCLSWNSNWKLYSFQDSTCTGRVPDGVHERWHRCTSVSRSIKGLSTLPHKFCVNSRSVCGYPGVLTTPWCDTCQEQPLPAAQTQALCQLVFSVNRASSWHPAWWPHSAHSSCLALHHLAAIWICTLCLDDILCHFCLLI